LSRLLALTLGNEEWVKENEDKIKKVFPNTFTHMQNLNMLKIGFGLKIIGIDWRTYHELSNAMVFFEKSGLLLRQDNCIKSNPHSIFT